MAAHKWTFKSRFRANAYGWNGTALATKRLREAVSEIKKVSKSDPVAAAEGAISLMERLWPALQGIDSSSGALGSAVFSTLVKLIPLVSEAHADQKTRRKWLNRLYDAICEDGINYLAPVADQWGALCGDAESANQWADQLLPLLRDSWTKGPAGGWVKGGSLCLSCLVATGRYDELRELLALRSFRSWHDDKFWAQALLRQGKIDEAIKFAESCRQDSPSYDAGSIVEFCAQTLIAVGRADEAYERYALQSVRSTTNLATFRQLVKQYPGHEPRAILLDLVAAHGPKGKWFAAAKDAGCLDVALQCAADESADPSTLIRAARDFLEKDPNFAAEVAFCAIQNLLAGGGYEPTTLDLIHAHRYLRNAAARCGRSAWAESELGRLVEQGASSGQQEFLRVLILECRREA